MVSLRGAFSGAFLAVAIAGSAMAAEIGGGQVCSFGECAPSTAPATQTASTHLTNWRASQLFGLPRPGGWGAPRAPGFRPFGLEPPGGRRIPGPYRL